jgi:UDP-2,3-diacylglucosamine pyrophosphatase LpxH
VRSGETEKLVPDGDMIVRAGDHGAEMYVIKSGHVRISRPMGGRTVVLSELGPGDFFGEMSLLESLPRDADATAVGETHLLVLNAGSCRTASSTDVRARDAAPAEWPGARAERRAREGPGRVERRAVVIIDAAEDRLFVISDLHLGNPSSTARTRLVEFLDYARITGTSVCINGDGFEMLQTSFSRLASDAVPVLNALRRLMREGNRVYYLVGNHDISLEHFLEDWLFTQIAPFLNLRSGGARIRIEHGHLYDPWFVRYPKSYEAGARVLGLALLVHPDVYSTYAKVQVRMAARRKGDPFDEVAAEMLFRGLRRRDLRPYPQRDAACQRALLSTQATGCRAAATSRSTTARSS